MNWSGVTGTPTPASREGGPADRPHSGHRETGVESTTGSGGLIFSSDRTISVSVFSWWYIQQDRGVERAAVESVFRCKEL